MLFSGTCVCVCVCMCVRVCVCVCGLDSPRHCVSRHLLRLTECFVVGCMYAEEVLFSRLNTSRFAHLLITVTDEDGVDSCCRGHH